MVMLMVLTLSLKNTTATSTTLLKLTPVYSLLHLCNRTGFGGMTPYIQGREKRELESRMATTKLTKGNLYVHDIIKK